MSSVRTYKRTAEGPVEIPPLTREVRKNLAGQQAAMFTQDGRLRRVIRIRESMRARLNTPAADQG